MHTRHFGQRCLLLPLRHEKFAVCLLNPSLLRVLPAGQPKLAPFGQRHIRQPNFRHQLARFPCRKPAIDGAHARQITHRAAPIPCQLKHFCDMPVFRQPRLRQQRGNRRKLARFGLIHQLIDGGEHTHARRFNLFLPVGQNRVALGNTQTRFRLVRQRRQGRRRRFVHQLRDFPLFDLRHNFGRRGVFAALAVAAAFASNFYKRPAFPLYFFAESCFRFWQRL